MASGTVAYGADSKLRAGISELGLTYVAGTLPTEAPLSLVPEAGRGQGLRHHRMRRDETHQPVPAKTLAAELAADAAGSRPLLGHGSELPR